MSRMNNKRYQQQLMLTMIVYMVVLFAADPLLHAAGNLPLKAMLALVPVLPVLYAIVLMWWRIRDSDELEQRTNLVALGVATALVSALSLVGEVLIWVFPTLMAGYGIAYRWVSRRYGMDSACVEEGSAWLPWYFAGIGAFMLAFAAYLWLRSAPGGAAMMFATAIFFMALGAVVWRRRSRALRQTDRDGA